MSGQNILTRSKLCWEALFRPDEIFSMEESGVTVHSLLFTNSLPSPNGVAFPYFLPFFLYHRFLSFLSSNFLFLVNPPHSLPFPPLSSPITCLSFFSPTFFFLPSSFTSFPPLISPTMHLFFLL